MKTIIFIGLLLSLAFLSPLIGCNYESNSNPLGQNFINKDIGSGFILSQSYVNASSLSISSPFDIPIAQDSGNFSTGDSLLTIGSTSYMCSGFNLNIVDTEAVAIDGINTYLGVGQFTPDLICTRNYHITKP